jgi:hypothetical protein
MRKVGVHPSQTTRALAAAPPRTAPQIFEV